MCRVLLSQLEERRVHNFAEALKEEKTPVAAGRERRLNLCMIELLLVMESSARVFLVLAILAIRTCRGPSFW